MNLHFKLCNIASLTLRLQSYLLDPYYFKVSYPYMLAVAPPFYGPILYCILGPR